MAKKASKKKRSTTKRDLVDPGKRRGGKRFAKRTSSGRFKEMDQASRSLSVDQRRKAKKKTKSGHGDQGDRPARRKGTKKR
jgi:hypothetical protein